MTFNNNNHNNISQDTMLFVGTTTYNPVPLDSISYSNTGPQHSRGLPRVVVTTLILGVIILSTIFGNALVIAAVVLEKSLRNFAANYLIASLAVADLLVALLVMPLAAVNEVSARWLLGPAVCDMWTSFDILCCTSSIFHLVAISIDRYWAVTRIDYIHNRSTARILIIVVLSWILSFIISVPPLIGWSSPLKGGLSPLTGQCLISQDQGYTVFSTFGAFYLPLLFMTVIYYKIYKAAQARIHRKKFQRRVNQTVPLKSRYCCCCVRIGHQSEGSGGGPPPPPSRRSTRSHPRTDGGAVDRVDQGGSTTPLLRTCRTVLELRPKGAAISPSSTPTYDRSRESSYCCNDDISGYDDSTYGGDLDLDVGGSGSGSGRGACRLVRSGGYTMESSRDRKNEKEKTEECDSALKALARNSLRMTAGFASLRDGTVTKNETIPAHDGLNAEPLSEPPFLNNSELKRAEELDAIKRGEANEQLVRDLVTRLSALKDREDMVGCGTLLMGGVGVVGDVGEDSVVVDDHKHLVNNSSRCLMDVRSFTMFNIDSHNYDLVTGCGDIDAEQVGANESLRAIQRRYSFDVKHHCFWNPRHPSKNRLSLISDRGHQRINGSDSQKYTPKLCEVVAQWRLKQEPVQFYKWRQTKNDGVGAKGLPKRTEPIALKEIKSSVMEALQIDRQDPFQSEVDLSRKTSFTEDQVIKTDRHRLFAASFRRRTHRSDSAALFSPKLTASRRQAKHREKAERKRERKAARTLAIVTGSFIFCWLPFFVVAIIRPFCREGCQYPVELLSVILWLGYFNSLLNPIIYTVFNQDFRAAFTRLLIGKYHQRRLFGRYYIERDVTPAAFTNLGGGRRMRRDSVKLVRRKTGNGCG